MLEAISTFLLFLPFILITLLANLADGRRQAGEERGVLIGLTYAFHAILFGGMALIGVLLQMAGRWVATAADTPIRAAPGVDPATMERIVAALPAIGLGLWVPAVAALVFLLPPVRQVLARFLPLDSHRAVHAVALSFTMLIVINLTVTLGIGLDTLSELTAVQDAAGREGSLMITLWTQQITMALWALIGVGWLSRRWWGKALERLGIVRPRIGQAAIGIGAGFVMVGVVMGLENLAAAVGFGPNPDVENLTDVLLGPLLTSIPGILTLGLAAGIGEETLFRGAMQPRFGLLLTSFLFALTHSNYGITLSTALVFVVGLVFGLLRRRFNTTTSMLAHATYNSTLGAIAYLALSAVQSVG